MCLKKLCRNLEKKLPKSNSEIFSHFHIPQLYPWQEKMSDDSNFYACLHGLVSGWEVDEVLEIGTGFGLGTMAILNAVSYVISIDLGNFGDLESTRMARRAAHCHGLGERWPEFFEADTQDTLSSGSWLMNPGLQDILRRGWPFGVLFIDGYHKGDGLFKDLYQFWPFLKSGGLVICDDIHDPDKYPQFDWVPDTWECFHAFLKTPGIHHSEVYVWNYPKVPSGDRPLGLIVKA